MQRIALLQPHLHRKKWLYSATAPSEIQYIYMVIIFLEPTEACLKQNLLQNTNIILYNLPNLP